MLSQAETIVAPITGTGAVAIIRLSGLEAWSITKKVFPSCPANPTPRYAYYGTFSTGDDGLALLFEGTSSYTGEESAELSIHGSTVSIESLLTACLDQGCRMAKPGEFTLRAFMNGKIQLDEAEGVREVIESRTDRQFAQALRLKSGALGSEIDPIRKSVMRVLAMVEASTDFSEEIGDLDRAQAKEILEPTLIELDRMLSTRRASRLLHQGATVVLIGRPNVGKSSLLNSILQQDRSIVTSIPGTTRDTVEASISLDGIPIQFIDTAGLRESDDEIEQLGIARSAAALDGADLALLVFDLNQGWTNEDQELLGLAKQKVIKVGNKADLASPSGNAINVSAKTREGIEGLLQEIGHVLGSGISEPSFLLDRHYDLLEQAKESIMASINVFSQEIPDDVAAVTLRQALRQLGEITGEDTPPDVIERIFGDFCLGK